MTQHSELTVERMREFGLGQQLLHIGAEMYRLDRFVRSGRIEHVRAGYERVLQLVDLTVRAQDGLNLRRELLRWRSFLAELYVAPEPDPEAHRLALRTLLQLHPESAMQIDPLGV